MQREMYSRSTSSRPARCGLDRTTFKHVEGIEICLQFKFPVHLSYISTPFYSYLVIGTPSTAYHFTCNTLLLRISVRAGV